MARIVSTRGPSCHALFADRVPSGTGDDMGPVICSVDDSDEARAAVRVARDLSLGLGAPLVLVHVEPATEAPGVSAAPAGQERLRAAERADAAELLASIAQGAGLGDDVSLHAEIGAAAERVVEISREQEASFVVVGSRGRGDMASAVLGSVSHGIIGAAPCPVVVVPPGRPTPRAA
jgi:nucleotide-binding universal stress UspA family protein